MAVATREYGLFIGGESSEAAGGDVRELAEPATGEPLARAALAGEADVDRAVEAARGALDGDWGKTPGTERARLLHALADAIVANRAELAELEARNVGKAISSVKAELHQAVENFRYYGSAIATIGGRANPIGGSLLFYSLKEPVGVAAQIVPWNYPLMMATWKLAPALAAGCSVVLKPDPQTPLTAIRLAELATEVGFPAGAVNVIAADGPTTGAYLVPHPGVDKVAFTGSTEVGRLIVQAAAGNLKKVSLELGGKSPNIVLADADVDLAIEGAANAIFFNHGQCCCAGSRLLVEKPVFDRVVEGVAARAQQIKVGPGLDPSTEMGPLVSQEQLDRVCGYMNAGEKEGARAVTGGKRIGEKGYFVEPTVLVGVEQNATVAQEEIFGPVLAVIAHDGDDDAVAIANNSIYGLSGAVFSSDVERARAVARRIRTGTMGINGGIYYGPEVPFGGYRQSGVGREMGVAGFEEYLEIKSVAEPAS